MLKNLIITFFLGFVLTYFGCGDSDNSSDSYLGGFGTYFVAEDWDRGNLPVGFPECGGPSWHGWKPKNYDCQWGDSELSTSIYYTSSRSFRNVRPSGDPGSMDLYYDISPSQTKIHLRMYVYFGSSFSDCGSGGREDVIHFIFFNTARGGVNFGVDLLTWNDWGDWPPECGSGTRELYFTFHSYYDDCNPPCNEHETAKGSYSEKCWNILDHLEEWHCVEFMWDLENHKAKMWIDEDLKIDRTICACNHSNINKAILSLWNSCSSCLGNSHDVYIDNVVISNHYIGPLAQ